MNITEHFLRPYHIDKGLSEQRGVSRAVTEGEQRLGDEANSFAGYAAAYAVLSDSLDREVHHFTSTELPLDPAVIPLTARHWAYSVLGMYAMRDKGHKLHIPSSLDMAQAAVSINNEGAGAPESVRRDQFVHATALSEVVNGFVDAAEGKKAAQTALDEMQTIVYAAFSTESAEAAGLYYGPGVLVSATNYLADTEKHLLRKVTQFEKRKTEQGLREVAASEAKNLGITLEEYIKLLEQDAERTNEEINREIMAPVLGATVVTAAITARAIRIANMDSE